LLIYNFLIMKLTSYIENRLIRIFVLIVVLLSVGLFLSIKTNSLEVFPSIQKESHVFFDTYHEYVDSTFSQSSVKHQSSEGIESITLSYSLSKSEAIQEPFVGLFFYRKDSVQPFFDLSGFNSIAVNIQSIRGERIPITFTLNYEGITDKDKLLSNLPLTYLLEYNEAQQYEIALDKFQIPSWWLRNHNLKKEDLTNIDFSRVNYIVVGSCQLLERGVEDKITIKGVSLYNNNTMKYVIFGILVILFGGVLIIFRLTKKRKIIIPYAKVDLEDKFGGETSKVDSVVNYVSSNYSNPDLNLNDIEKTVGISSREIGTIFKNELGSSFKKYLNLIRLTEIKRLLIETDQTISVIAYQTGYSNVSHFNRVFKSAMNMSPKDYREQTKNRPFH
jgi:AraC-like DNA-binding protein